MVRLLLEQHIHFADILIDNSQKKKWDIKNTWFVAQKTMTIELSLLSWIERRLKNDFITIYKYTH